MPSVSYEILQRKGTRFWVIQKWTKAAKGRIFLLVTRKIHSSQDKRVTSDIWTISKQIKAGYQWCRGQSHNPKLRPYEPRSRYWGENLKASQGSRLARPCMVSRIKFPNSCHFLAGAGKRYQKCLFGWKLWSKGYPTPRVCKYIWA